MKKFVIFVLFALVFQMGSASAVSTPQDQLTITVEAGRSYTFYLLMQNNEDSTEEIVLETDGYAGRWIRFGGDRDSSYSVSIPPFTPVFLPVTVSVPIETDTVAYQVSIDSDGSTLVDMDIRVTPSLEDIRTLEGASSLDSQFEQLEQGIINTSSDIVNELISGNQNLGNKISDLEQEVRSSANQLQEEKKQLQEKIDNIDGLTGNIAFGTSVASFIVGVVVAFFALQLFANRRSIKLPSRKKKKEGFDFSPPKE